MTALNKQALREAAQEEIMLRSVSDTSDAWQDEASPEAVLALLDELEAAEERYEDMLRQARSFREAHDSASELIRKLERNKLIVKLPTTKLWAGKVACYEASEIIAVIAAAGIDVKGE
ncbi:MULTISPECIES: hypothetical protein [Citrobacter freundii complex]|uniref:hypothetical protein n=1 Tax=Citrobacter freundii complex TaxID=1344959 RepID=UPI001A27D19C|nr:hypothetical protein [Citrobacter braakii]